MTLILEPTKEIKLAILENELGGLVNTKWLLEARYRVNKRIGQTKEELKPIEDDLVKIESLLDSWEKERQDVLDSK